MSRREEILDALIEILKDQGLNSNFTMKELAEAVNIGKSTIYEYFNTKEEILNQAVLRIIETGVSEVFKEEVDDDSTFEEAFKKEIKSLYEIAMNSAYVIGIVTPGYKQKVPEALREDIVGNVKCARDEYEQRFNKIFKKALIENIITLENKDMKAFVVSSLVVGSIFRIANLECELKDVNVDKYVNIIYDTVLKIM